MNYSIKSNTTKTRELVVYNNNSIMSLVLLKVFSWWNGVFPPLFGLSWWRNREEPHWLHKIYFKGSNISSIYAAGHSIEKFSPKSASVCGMAVKPALFRVFRCPSITQARGGTLAVFLRRVFKRGLSDDDLYWFCKFKAHCWTIYFVPRFKHTSSVIRTALHLQWHFCFVCWSFRWKA